MKTIFICTHCVLILTLITLTLLLINSALSLADNVDSAQLSSQLVDQFRKSNFQEDTYSSGLSDSSNSFNPYQTDKSSDKSSANEDDLQLNNWDNVYNQNNFLSSGSNLDPNQNANPATQQTAKEQQQTTSNVQEEALIKEKNELKLSSIKTEQPSTKKYVPCNREFGNRTSKKTSGDNGFKVKISGNPEKYTPGELYTGNYFYCFQI